jgi:hypothetical protein
MFLFLLKLAKLKGLYDAATQVAVQRASEIERMKFDISVKSPIIVFPSDPSRSRDVLVLRLGEITAKNSYEDVANKITASLTGIQLVSNLYADSDLSTLKIVDDIDVNADVLQTSGIDRSKDLDYPDTQVRRTRVETCTELTVELDIHKNLGRPLAFDAGSICTAYTVVAVDSEDLFRRTRRSRHSPAATIYEVSSTRCGYSATTTHRPPTRA